MTQSEKSWFFCCCRPTLEANSKYYLLFLWFIYIYNSFLTLSFFEPKNAPKTIPSILSYEKCSTDFEFDIQKNLGLFFDGFWSKYFCIFYVPWMEAFFIGRPSLSVLTVQAEMVSYDALMNDAFFASLSKSVQSRPGRPGSAEAPPPRTPAAWAPEPVSEQERIRPPYYSVVQLSIRRAAFEGGRVLIFIAAQSEPLAEELVRSCQQLKTRRALQAVQGLCVHYCFYSHTYVYSDTPYMWLLKDQGRRAGWRIKLVSPYRLKELSP